MDIAELLSGTSSDIPPQTDLKAGDRVRSYDFAGNFTCYAEGVIEAITEPIEGCPRYRIRVDKRLFNGQEVAAEGPVYPPVNGTPTLMGKLTNLVVRVH